MENQEKESSEPIVPIVDRNPILGSNDYRITGDDYFTVCVSSVIMAGPSLSDGEKVVKDYLKLVQKTNKEKGFDFARVYCPGGFILPPEWVDEIYNY